MFYEPEYHADGIADARRSRRARLRVPNLVWALGAKGTPQPIVEKLYAEVQKALADPAVQQRIAATAGEPSHVVPKDIEPFVKAEIAKWAAVVKRAGIKVE